MLAVISKQTLDAANITYDCALPQDLYDGIYACTGNNPLGHVVSLYPNGADDWQGLQAVTIDGACMLEAYYKTKGGVLNERA